MVGEFVIGGVAVLYAVVGLVRLLLSDKSLKDQIDSLSRQLSNEREERRVEIATLNEKISTITALYDEQRREKHRALNELTKAQVLLGMIIDFAERCTCSVMDPIRDVLARVSLPDMKEHQ